MLPVEPEEVMPTPDPIPSVPAALRMKLPAPETTLVPQLSVPVTVKLRELEIERPLSSVSEPPDGTAKFTFVVVSVPADCVNVLPAPLKLTVTAVLDPFVNVPPV